MAASPIPASVYSIVGPGSRSLSLTRGEGGRKRGGQSEVGTLIRISAERVVVDEPKILAPLPPSTPTPFVTPWNGSPGVSYYVVY